MPKLRKCLKSLSCNTQCDTMRPETGSGSRTSPSSPTSPFLPNVCCLSQCVSSIKRPRIRDEPPLLPLLQQPQQHLPSIQMPCPHIPGAISVATPTPHKCPAYRHSCYACCGNNHYTAMCRQLKKIQHAPHNKRQIAKGYQVIVPWTTFQLVS